MVPPRSIDRELGELSVKVKNLSEEFQRECDAASTHRKDLRIVVDALGSAVRNLTTEIANMKPLLLDYATTSAENRAADRVRKWAIGTFLSAATMVGAILNEVWKHFAGYK